ncbi:MAG: hypothetical protein P1U56_13975 [Saprospiraceae bacterium]|nr:hypothetical protein [Saprospiraceae bacterium]
MKKLSWKSLLLVLYCILSSCTLFGQHYPYSLNVLHDDKDTFVNRLFKTMEARNVKTKEENQQTFEELQAYLSSSDLNSRRRALCLSLSGYLLVELKERNQAFPFYRNALPLVKDFSKDDPVYSIVHGSYGMYMAYYDVHDIAIPHLKEAINGLSANNIKGSFREKVLYGAIINSFHDAGQLDSSMHYLDVMIKECKRKADDLIISQTYNNAGLFCHKVEDYSQAIRYFDSALKWADTSASEGLFHHVNAMESRSHSLVETGNMTQAISDLEFVYQNRKKLEIPKYSMQALAYLINYLVQAEREKEALIFVEKESSYFNQDQRLNQRNAPAYLAVANLYNSIGKEEDAQPYVNKYNQYLADLYQKVDLSKSSSNLNAFMRYRHQAFEQNLKLEQLENEKLGKKLFTTRFLLILIGIGLSLLVGFVYAIGRWRVIQKEQKLALEQKTNEALQLKNENLAFELRYKEQDIRRIAADNKIRTELKRKFARQLKNLSNSNESDLKKELRYLIHDLNDTIENQDQLSELQQQIETINSSFEKHIQDRIQGISAMEVKMCSLIKIGMSNQEIAKILNKQNSTIRTYKVRLKTKAGMDSVRELEQMVREL